MNRLAAPAPPASTITPGDPKKVEALAKIVGADPTDLQTLATGLTSLLSSLGFTIGYEPGATTEEAARRKLSVHQLEIIRNTPGATALGFLAAQRAMGGKS